MISEQRIYVEKSYESLSVYQRAFTIAIALHKLSLNFPKIEQYSLADQIRRASMSICANIAEGYARRLASNQEFKRFLSIAFGSAEEMRVWISFAAELGYVDRDASKYFINEYYEIGKMLRSLGKNSKKMA